MQFTRYAVYYVPPVKAPWACFAASWLGWDMEGGQTCDHPHLPELPLAMSGIVARPQRYGLHATLKPPFRLAAGVSQDNLEAACDSLSRSLSPLTIGPLHLTRLGRFLALCPPASGELSALAASCVRELDHLRAPLAQPELKRRRTANLTRRQEAQLTDWGYPYVMDDFRFHITLTGRLSKPDLNGVETVLGRVLTPLLPPVLMLGDLSLTGENPEGRFHLLQRFALSATGSCDLAP